MSLVVVGSVAFDSIETPFGRQEEILGGSATYFAAAASYFSAPSLVAVVGEDFPEDALEFLTDRGVNLEGLSRTHGKTFRWKGRYGPTLADPETLDTRLGVFEHFDPVLPDSYRKAELVFLANIDPVLQRRVLEQVDTPKFVAADTMNFWISGKREELLEMLASVDVLIINDSEARQLAQEHNIVGAARKIREMGPKMLIVKRGEHGAMLFDDQQQVYYAPAFPVLDVRDPTGAGDSFAGGMMGFLGARGEITPATLRQAMVAGCVMASFAVEGFGLERVRNLMPAEVRERLTQFRQLTAFDPIPVDRVVRGV